MADTSTYNPYVDTGDWWDRLKKNGASGLFDIGAGIYNRNAATGEAAQRLATAQGPLYGKAMAGAGANLDQAGNFNPQDFAAQRFGQQQALLSPVYEKQLNDLMNSLNAKGTLGLSTYNPGVPGITPNGTPMSPQLAAFFAAQNAEKATSAYNSMDQGQQYLNNLLQRSGMLQGQAANAQNTGITAQRTQPSRATANAQILKGAGDIFKNSGAIQGLFGQGMDWLGNQTGLWGGNDPWKMNSFQGGGDMTDLGYWG